MPNPILLLRLEGPLQSWGVRARWSRRDTGPEPSKSAIIGLLGCAAGIVRPDWRSGAEPDRTLEEWDRSLRFGVRIDRPGVVETDYHTVQGRHRQANGKFKRTKTEEKYAGGKWVFWNDIHTEITWRDYLHDPAFLVALASDDHELLRRLAGNAKSPDWSGNLRHPKWPLYLGRKSCVPSRPVLDRLSEEYDDLEHALKSAPLSVRGTKAGVKQLDAWIEDPAEGDYERQDAIRLNQVRFYDFRRCRRMSVSAQKLGVLDS